MVLWSGSQNGRNWSLAYCLRELEKEANALAPNRSKASDGSIGDAAHASRTSAHNPDADGWVCALDLTHDPANGFDARHIADTIAERIVDGHETRVAGIGDWNVTTGRERWFALRNGVWSWRDADLHGGSHITHIHLEVKHSDSARNPTDPWEIDVALSTADKAWIKSLIQDSEARTQTRIQDAEARTATRVKAVWDAADKSGTKVKMGNAIGLAHMLRAEGHMPDAG